MLFEHCVDGVFYSLVPDPWAPALLGVELQLLTMYLNTFRQSWLLWPMMSNIEVWSSSKILIGFSEFSKILRT